MSEPRAELTEAEREVVRRMAYAGGYSNEKADRYVHQVESILAARLAARDAEWRQAIEALPDQMAESWGHGASWLTTGTTVAAVVGDWLRALVREVTGDVPMSLTKGQADE